MKLIEFLKEQEIRQVELAESLQVDPSVFSLWARGIRPIPIKYFDKLMILLGLGPDELTELIRLPRQ